MFTVEDAAYITGVKDMLLLHSFWVERQESHRKGQMELVNIRATTYEKALQQIREDFSGEDVTITSRRDT
jgi:hypothetical protein